MQSDDYCARGHRDWVEIPNGKRRCNTCRTEGRREARRLKRLAAKPNRKPVAADWKLEAKCKGQGSSGKWDTNESIPEGKRNLLARAACSGCPVMNECAEDTLENNDFSVVRAGIPLDVWVTKKLMHQYNDLRRFLGREELLLPRRYL